MLTDSADEVTAYVGDPLGAGARFELDAYDVEGNLLKRETVTTTEAAITTKISVNSAGKYAIAFFALYDTVHGHTTVRDVRAHRLGNRFASVRRATLTALGRGRYRMDATLSLHHAPRQASLSVGASILQRGHTLIQAKPVLLRGARLQARKVSVTLPTTLRKGRYELRLRLLEIATSGVVQSSAMVTRTLAVNAP